MIASETYLERSLDGLDVNTLKFINVNNPELLKELKKDDVKLLWKACQIPDFRKISNQDHAGLIIKIFDLDAVDVPQYLKNLFFKIKLRQIVSVRRHFYYASITYYFFETLTYSFGFINKKNLKCVYEKSI